MKYFFILFTTFLFSFVSMAQQTADSSRKMISTGGDRDKHGCIGSAGYTWSVLKGSCIRIFESGIRMNAQATLLSKSTSAFVVFNNSKSKAELYIPSLTGSLILNKTGKNNQAWKNGQWLLRSGQKLEIYKNNKLQYSQE